MLTVNIQIGNVADDLAKILKNTILFSSKTAQRNIT